MRKVLNFLGWAIVAIAAVLLALSAWIMAPFRLGYPDVMQTAESLIRAPFASTLVIGDSRVTNPPSPAAVERSQPDIGRARDGGLPE